MPASNNKLKPDLSEKFSSVIWKVEIDEGEQTVAIETRDKGAHTAAFSVLNYQTGKCYIKERSPENSWWWGLDKIHNGIMYLHGYKNENSPEHRGIIAWDSNTGETKWQKFDYSLKSVSDHGLIVCNALIQYSKAELISASTGEPLKGEIPAPVKRNILLPQVYENVQTLPVFIAENIAGPVLHLKHNGKECWAFHTKTEDGFTQKLVITANKELVLSENLAIGIQKLNPEAFFIHKNHLFCIRDNNYEITSYLLM